jgi:hypothetical protein
LKGEVEQNVDVSDSRQTKNARASGLVDEAPPRVRIGLGI